MDDDDDDDLVGAHRPGADWQCADCAQPWPCPVFRRRLRDLYQRDPDKLTSFMVPYRNRAAADLTDLTPTQIETRFLGWISEPPRRRLRSI